MRTAILFFLAGPCFAQTYAVQAQSNQYRNGAYTDSSLTVANVTARFRKLSTLPVTGTVRGHLNVVAGVTVAGQHCVGTSAPTICDGLYAATQANHVYAWDANNPTNLIWHRYLGVSDTSYVVGNYFIQGGISASTQGPIGAFASPVADVAHGNLWVQYTSADHSVHLRALNLATGADALSDIAVAATFPGCGGTCTLNWSQHKVVVPLAISGGKIWLITSSHNDITPYQSWLIGYDATTGTRTNVWAGGVDSSSTSCWMSAQGPAILADGSMIYINGTGTYNGAGDWGDTLIKFSTAAAITGWYTPDKYAALSAADIEYGSSGAIIVPNAATSTGQAILAGGKEGCLNLFDPSALPGLQSGSTAVGTCNAAGTLQSFRATTTSPTSGTGFFSGALVYASNGNGTGVIFAEPNGEPIKAYAYNETTGAITTTATLTGPTYQYPVSFSFVSNNGAAGTKMLVVSHSATNQAGCCVNGPGSYIVENGQGILSVLDATTLGVIYDSQGKAADTVGIGSKWLRPAIYHGRVFVGTGSAFWPFSTDAAVQVYGVGTAAPAWIAH